LQIFGADDAAHPLSRLQPPEIFALIRAKKTILRCLIVAVMMLVGCRDGVDALDHPRRPQEPKPPYPYEASEVCYPNEDAGVQLCGTLTLPHGRTKAAAVLLILGSGQLQRDEVVANHKIFLVLADALTRRGLAVLRVDKRGLGKSTGDYARITSVDLADDVLAGVAYLRSRPEIDADHIGLVGHSEGGLIGPMAANRSDHIAFVASLGGPTLPGDQVLLLQSERIARADGLHPSAIAAIQTFGLRLHALIRTGADRNGIAEQLPALIKDLPEREQRVISGNLDLLASPWYRFFIDYDPAPALAAVKCPVLYLIGSNDLQVTAPENLAVARRIQALRSNRDFTIIELPGINHALQTSKTGSPSEYERIEETISPKVLDALGDWIVQRINESPRELMPADDRINTHGDPVQKANGGMNLPNKSAGGDEDAHR
jgi:uncharacterized protein